MKKLSNKTVALIATLLLFALLLGASCNRGGERAAAPRAQKPARIVSLSPSATEILHGVGAFDRVVAVSDYCNYPPEVKDLPRVGGWSNPNLEQIASLNPDLVIFADAQAQFIKDKIEALGIRTLAVPSRTLEDALKAIELTGQATGEMDAARELAERTRATIATVQVATERAPRRRVLCVVDRVPGTLRDIYVAGEGSFIAQLIQVAGGEPVSPPAREGWGKLQKEAVIAFDPDVIIDLMMQKPAGGLAE
ncbi:MAG: ABC transporter substrate-binding protein, partial [Rubrivivax sp.]|nr:ABC transporter substrate-binding protein [Pyrinomonadaceae bacterium]